MVRITSGPGGDVSSIGIDERGGQSLVPDIRRVFPTAQDQFSTGSAESVTGPGGRQDIDFVDPRPGQTTGRELHEQITGEKLDADVRTVNVVDSAATEAAEKFPDLPTLDNPFPDGSELKSSITKLVIGLVAVLLGFVFLRNFAQGIGEGVAS